MSTITDKILRVSKRDASTNGAASTDVPEWYVLGGGEVGAAVAGRLRAAGVAVRVVDETHDPAEGPGTRGDPADVELLARAGLADATAVVVATPRDRRNLLVAQLARARFGVETVIVLVHSPALCDVVAAAGHRVICVPSVLSEAVATGLTDRQPDGTGPATG
jgi:Trk K+ transport system NAD-binding subunit